MQKAMENHRIIVIPCTIIMAENSINMALSPRQTLDGQRVLRISRLAVRIATWNVRSMYEAGKLANAIQEMNRMNIDIMGVSEVRWPRRRQCSWNDCTLYYFGNDDRNHGQGVIVNRATNRAVKNFVRYSDRVCLLQLQTSPANINIIQVYAPTADKGDDMIEEFYD